MAITTSWTPLTPDGADSPSDGDNVIRALKSSIGDRMRHGGHEWETVAGTELGAGRHKCLDSGDTDVIAAGVLLGEFYIFAGDGTTKLFTLADSTAAAPNKLTLGSAIVLTANGGIVTTGTATITTLHVLGNTDLDGTLNVDGATTLKQTTIGTGGTLTCNDVATMAGGLVSTDATTMSGNIFKGVTAISTTYSVQTGDNTIFASTGSAPYVITLPNAATSSGRVISIALTSGGPGDITVKSSGGTLDNVAAASGLIFTLDPSGSRRAATFQSDGTNWYTIGQTLVP